MSTNFVWTKIAERGQQAVGFVEVFELIGEHRAIAILHFMPQHTHLQERVVVTLLLEGEKRNWTDGTFDSVFEDIENRINEVKDVKLKKHTSLKHIDTQIFTLKNIDGFDYLSHGDWSFPV